jgi:hypothetical protein
MHESTRCDPFGWAYEYAFGSYVEYVRIDDSPGS